MIHHWDLAVEGGHDESGLLCLRYPRLRNHGNHMSVGTKFNGGFHNCVNHDLNLVTTTKGNRFLESNPFVWWELHSARSWIQHIITCVRPLDCGPYPWMRVVELTSSQVILMWRDS